MALKPEKNFKHGLADSSYYFQFRAREPFLQPKRNEFRAPIELRRLVSAMLLELGTRSWEL
jgi:hypothetical protein